MIWENSGSVGVTVLVVAFIPLPDDLPEVRLEVSLRLKAARYLAGGLRESKGKNKVGYEAGPVTVEELAQHELIVANGIRRNRLDAYEQMKTDPRPMELQVIADALDIPRDFLLAPLSKNGPRLQTNTVEQLIDAMRRLTREAQELINQQGRDIGKRDLQRRADAGRSDPPREDAA